MILDARHGFKLADKIFLNELFLPPDVESDNNNNIIKNHDIKRKMKLFKPEWKLQIILTKCDLVSREDLARRITAIKDELTNGISNLEIPKGIFMKTIVSSIFPISGLYRQGILDIQKDIASLVKSNPYLNQQNPEDTIEISTSSTNLIPTLSPKTKLSKMLSSNTSLLPPVSSNKLPLPTSLTSKSSSKSSHLLSKSSPLLSKSSSSKSWLSQRMTSSPPSS